MKWLSLHLGGQLWSVYLVSPKSAHLRDHAGARCVGMCVYDKSKIYLSKNQDTQALEDSLLHELLHATLYVSGAHSVYKSPQSEERVVGALVPVWHRLLKDLGFVFPKVSK